jgi:hypothetical protein
MSKLALAALLFTASIASGCAVDTMPPIDESAEFYSERRINTFSDLSKDGQYAIKGIYQQKLAGRVEHTSTGITKFGIEPDKDAACWAYPGNVGCWFGEWLVSCEKNANTNDEWDCGVTHEDELD